MSVCCEFCVLSSRGLCVEPITRQEESYRLWCVSEYDRENSTMMRLGPTGVLSTHDRNTRVGTLIVATIYLKLIQNRYMFRSSTVLQCSHQHCVQTVASDVEVVGYL